MTRINAKQPMLLLVILLAFAFGRGVAFAQVQEHAERIRPPAQVRGFIGGESHDSWVVHARKGQRMTVLISWKREHQKNIGDNNAEFWVGNLPDFNGEGELGFGWAGNNRRRWSGRIPKTADYYIYVVAHPSARYTLRVTVK